MAQRACRTTIDAFDGALQKAVGRRRAKVRAEAHPTYACPSLFFLHRFGNGQVREFPCIFSFQDVLHV